MGFQLVSLREGESVYGNLGQVIEHRDAIVRSVVIRSSVGDFNQQATRLVDEERQKMTRSDDVRVDRKPEYPESFVQVVIPERLVPLRRAAFRSSPPQMSFTRISI